MFTDQLTRAVAAAPLPQLNRLSDELWKAYAAGALSDNDAQAAAEAIQARRVALRQPPAPTRSSALRPPARRSQRSPDRQASIERRRRMVGTIAMPPSLACKFTWGEQAALRVVGNEVRKHGVCSLPIPAIAAMAGVHRTTVQNALRQARRLNLATVQERRRRGQASLTNIVRVVSQEWLTWIRKGPRASSQAILGEGSNKKLNTTDTVSPNTNQTGFGASWYRHFEHYDPGSPSTGRRGP
jgi:hypothetical protein